MTFAEFLSLVDGRSAALRDAVAAATGLTARVPGCPDWALRDLVTHLGGVQRFWARAVTAADPSGPPSIPSGPEPSDADLLEWSAESARQLLAALGEAGPDAPCWAWWPTEAAPHTAFAVARHQVQEAAVHAYDAQDTTGKPEPIPGLIAVDGVAEFLTVPMGSLSAWPHRPARITFSATDGPSWTVDLSSTGIHLDPAESGEPVATVHAPVSDLVLALYGRVPFDDLQVTGDRGVLTELRGWAAAAAG